MLEISCAFATSIETPAHVALAEELGYRRAWLYDSPALYPDVWAMLALTAERTSRIHLGPGVLVPHLRHPMTNAAGIAMLEALAPGRVEVAIGSGFTGRMTMGQRPLPWHRVRAYVEAVKSLLAGETVEWEGGMTRMIHPPGFVAERPVTVPLLLGTGGRRGLSVARDLADGVFVASPRGIQPSRGRPPWRVVVLTFGTVLDVGEDPGSGRVVAAAGHGLAVGFHGMYERDPASLQQVAGGEAWARRLEAIPASERHLALHELHLVGVTERDAPLVTGERMRERRLALTSSEWREELVRLEALGATEIAYQPAGPDIPGELRRFASAAGL